MTDMAHPTAAPGGTGGGFASLADGEAVGEGFDLRQLLSVIRNYMISIIAIIAASLALGIVLTMLQTPQYTATVSMQIDDNAADVLQSGRDLQSSSDDFDANRFLNTQLDILKSRVIAKRVADKLKLYGNSRFLAAMEVDFTATAGVDRKQLEELTLGLLRSHMLINLPRQSRIANISFVSADPSVSAEVANAYADQFIQANLQRKFESTAYARDFLASQLSATKLRLEKSERDLNNYARAAGIIRTSEAAGKEDSPGMGNSVTTASLLQLNEAANQAQSTRIAAEGRWLALSKSSPMNARDVLQNPTVQSLLSKRSELETLLREERVRHLGGHPSVMRLEAQIATLNQQLNSVVGSVRNSVQQEYQAALSAEQSLNRQVSSLKADTLNEQDLGVQYTILAREAETNRTLYDGLLQRYKEVTAAAGIASSNIALIDRADPPLGPSSPNLVVNLAYALFGGFVLAGLLVLVRMQLDDSIRVPEDVEVKLGLPILGIVPKTDSTDIAELLDDPKASISEAYNSLRGAIGFSMPEGAPRTLLITSSAPSEGKSTTANALARGFAKLGKRVLLVDVDMRRPSVHRQFGISNEVGLSSILVGQVKSADAIRKSEHPGLFLLAAGPIPPSPTELIASPQLKALIEEFRSTFDMVVLDSPPILGLADAPVLSSVVEGTLLVIESDRNRRGVLKGTLRRMRLAKGRVIGVALTKFDSARAASYTYYYGYGYDYYAYESSDEKRGRKGLFARRGRAGQDLVEADA